MFNNGLEHSAARCVVVSVRKTAAATRIQIYDDGVGIFKKIQAALELLDERHSVLELAKGKFTTDPANHSGEGIFFSSRMFDEFDILSGEVYFSHEFDKKEDWILQRSTPRGGTIVTMLLHNHTAIEATKGAVEAFERQLAREIAPRRVNVIAAGLVKTPAYDGMPEAAREAMYAGYAQSALLGRVGEPADVAHTAMYLMTSSWVTGTIQEVDGGRP